MTKKAHLTKASLINSASSENGALFYIYASLKPKVDTSKVLSAFHCNSCNTQFAAIAETKKSIPFCVTCGDDDVEMDKSDEAPEIEDFADDDELANVECSNCKTQNIMTLQTASKMGSQIHCVTCGSTINYNPPVEAEADMGEDYNIEDDLDQGLDSDEEDVDLTQTENIPSEYVEPTGEKEEVAAEEEKPEESPEAEDALEGESSSDDEAGEESSSSDEDSDEEDEGDEEEDFDDADIEESSLIKIIKKGSFSLTRNGDVLVASIGEIPVAHLEKADAGQNENSFFSTSFDSAIRHGVKKLGAEKALAHYGFKFTTIQVPVSESVKTKVAATLTKEEAKLEKKIADMSKDFEQSQSIAMAALNKNFFRGKQNPLRSAFIDELTVAGVRSPKKLVDKILANYSSAYSKAVIELARELMTKSVKHRNELANSVGEMNYRTDASDESEEQDLETNWNPLETASLEDSLSTGVKRSFN